MSSSRPGLPITSAKKRTITEASCLLGGAAPGRGAPRQQFTALVTCSHANRITPADQTTSTDTRPGRASGWSTRPPRSPISCTRAPSSRPAGGCWRPAAAWERRPSRSPATVRTLSSPRSTSPRSHWRSPASACEAAGLTNVIFEQADLFALPYAPASFDHVFVCFVLEHLSDPEGALAAIAGRHQARRHPDRHRGRPRLCVLPPRERATPAGRSSASCDLQAASGGDSLIGRRLYPMLVAAGLRDVRVVPKMVYVDATRAPIWSKGSPATPSPPWSRGCERRRFRPGLIDPRDLGAGHRRPAPRRGAGRRLLLHVLQGHGGQLT